MSEAPDGVGICLSGGGLRAAMFSLGALQVLQEQRGLLYGPRAARWLAAVSGGSYIAATYAVNAHALHLAGDTSARPPLARDSPEERHVLTHGRYLVTPMPGSALAMLTLMLLNASGLVMLFLFAAVMVNDFAMVGSWIDWVARAGEDIPGPIAVVAFLASVYALVRGLYSGHQIERYVLPFAGFGGLILTAGPALDSLASQSWAHGASAWFGVGLGGVALMGGSVGMSFVLAKRGVVGNLAAVANWTQVVSVRLTLLGVLLATAVDLRADFLRWFEDDDPISGILTFFGVLFATLLIDYLMQRYTLHRQYRDRIQRCFGVVTNRAGTTLPRTAPLLSDLRGGPFPDLLISATANVTSIDPQGHRRAFAPFVYASDVCGIPGQDDAWFPTENLELGRLPLPSGAEEHLVSLPVAVATTGAAVSPSMGRYTQASARPVIAALNIRLGRWLPNVQHARRRRFVREQTQPRNFATDTRLGRAYDELLPEMLGITNTDMYVSDGGHYDNLGLMALLRTRCAEIWCVDASPDPYGRADELARVLGLAHYELDITHTLDLKAFRTDNKGHYPTLYVSGTLAYPGGETAKFHVVKLGLDTETPPALLEYATIHRPFPHHPTLHQWFDEARSSAYRDLGRHAAIRCLSSLASA